MVSWGLHGGLTTETSDAALASWSIALYFFHCVFALFVTNHCFKTCKNKTIDSTRSPKKCSWNLKKRRVQQGVQEREWSNLSRKRKREWVGKKNRQSEISLLSKTRGHATSSASFGAPGELMPLDFAHVRAPSPTKNLATKWMLHQQTKIEGKWFSFTLCRSKISIHRTLKH